MQIRFIFEMNEQCVVSSAFNLKRTGGFDLFEVKTLVFEDFSVNRVNPSCLSPVRLISGSGPAECELEVDDCDWGNPE